MQVLTNFYIKISNTSTFQNVYFRAESLCMKIIQVLLDSFNISPYINPLKTKRRLFYLKTQSVPRCKHFSSRL